MMHHRIGSLVDELQRQKLKNAQVRFILLNLVHFKESLDMPIQQYYIRGIAYAQPYLCKKMRFLFTLDCEVPSLKKQLNMIWILFCVAYS